MSAQQVNKVDLSLDDIIRLNKKKQPGKGGTGKNNRGQGNAGAGGQGNAGVKGQGNASARGQGLRGRKNARGTGSGVSPLNRRKTGLGTTGGGTRGQRGNLRGRVGSRGSLSRAGSSSSRGGSRGKAGRGGSATPRGGSVARSNNNSYSTLAGFTNNTRGLRAGGMRGNRRETLHPALELASQAGFDLRDIQTKLARVKDKHRLCQLQSPRRNEAPQKVVLDKRYDRQRLFCESQDLLIVYDCKQPGVVDWFVRKDRKRPLTHFEEDAQNCVKNWSPVSGERYRLTCDLMAVNTAILAAAVRHYLGGRGALRGGLSRGGGGGGMGGHIATTTIVNSNRQTAQRGAGGGRGGRQQQQQQEAVEGSAGVNRVTLKRQRQQAMQALEQARKTVAQLEQQTARQNFVNARRGIAQQQSPLQLRKKNRGMYSSNLSLASRSSSRSSSLGRQLQGTQITAFSPSPSPSPSPFTPSPSPDTTRGRRRWRAKSKGKAGAPSPISSSTLTISFDNPVTGGGGGGNDFGGHHDFSAPHARPPVAMEMEAPAAPPRQRRRQWRRQNSQSHSPENLDLSRGATPSFSHQLAKLKPTVSTQYVFQKKVFSHGNTSYSLNDRFSGSSSQDAMGRKVFM